MNSKQSNIFFRLGVFFMLAFGSLAYAEGPVIRSGETVGVEANQVLEGDFYGFAQTLTLSGAAERDVYVVGGSITTNAPIAEDLVALGGVVQVHGPVSDDARIVGGEVVIAEPVTDDLVVLGGTVHVLSTASVGGDLIFFGGEVRIDGPVEGTVYGTADTLRIDSHVGGDITVRTGTSFTLGDASEVIGNISYKSPTELVRGQGAVVNGTITMEDVVLTPEPTGVRPLLINVLILIFSSLTIFFILRTRTEKLVKQVMDGYGRFGLIGLGMLLAIPIVSVILMASIIGALVGIVLLFGYLMLIMVALMSLPILFGTIAQRLLRLGEQITLFTVVIGVFTLVALLLVPVLGGLLVLFGFLVLIGALVNELYVFFKHS